MSNYNNNNNQRDKSRVFQLEWRDEDRKYPAGVGFHEEGYDEYRLKIDVFSPSRRYYVRAVEFHSADTKYRLETIDDNETKSRKTLGEGYETTTGSIKIEIPPYKHDLVLRKVK